MQDPLSDPKSVVIAFAAAYTAWEQAMEAAEEYTDDPFKDKNSAISTATFC